MNFYYGVGKEENQPFLFLPNRFEVKTSSANKIG
jgi:hypothetical protein